MSRLFYRKGYKYQVAEPVKIFVGIFPKKDIETEFLLLDTEGWLYIDSGYAYDGPSGPMIDTKDLMVPSLAHDALYQLIRMALLPFDCWIKADQAFKVLCKQNKVWGVRVWYALKGLKLANGTAAQPANKKEIMEAP